MIISFTGFMGSGKTTIARKVSELFRSPHIDLDTCIEGSERRSIAEIFREDGEEAFRAMEESCLQRIIRGHTEISKPPSLLFLSLGGGSVISAENRGLIKKHTRCIYLKASIDTIIHRVGEAAFSRPLVSGLDQRELRSKVEKLYLERAPLYEDCASLTIETDYLSQDEIVKLISETTLSDVLSS